MDLSTGSKRKADTLEYSHSSIILGQFHGTLQPLHVRARSTIGSEIQHGGREPYIPNFLEAFIEPPPMAHQFNRQPIYQARHEGLSVYEKNGYLEYPVHKTTQSFSIHGYPIEPNRVTPHHLPPHYSYEGYFPSTPVYYDGAAGLSLPQSLAVAQQPVEADKKKLDGKKKKTEKSKGIIMRNNELVKMILDDFKAKWEVSLVTPKMLQSLEQQLKMLIDGLDEEHDAVLNTSKYNPSTMKSLIEWAAKLFWEIENVSTPISKGVFKTMVDVYQTKQLKWNPNEALGQQLYYQSEPKRMANGNFDYPHHQPEPNQVVNESHQHNHFQPSQHVFHPRMMMQISHHILNFSIAEQNQPSDNQKKSDCIQFFKRKFMEWHKAVIKMRMPYPEIRSKQRQYEEYIRILIGMDAHLAAQLNFGDGNVQESRPNRSNISAALGANANEPLAKGSGIPKGVASTSCSRKSSGGVVVQQPPQTPCRIQSSPLPTFGVQTQTLAGVRATRVDMPAGLQLKTPSILRNLLMGKGIEESEKEAARHDQLTQQIRTLMTFFGSLQIA
ncbi:unnamed protein product [Orchesella dallaii]|uniref:Uncharacterized protein n=1 Tax=Orchesella dallaii TaxID=48710 RepID=A0ABP1QPA4_9HEXA